MNNEEKQSRAKNCSSPCRAHKQRFQILVDGQSCCYASHLTATTMSLSLSSLLNPSPTDEAGEQAQNKPASTDDGEQHSPVSRRDSLPPISYARSPEMHHAQIPMYNPPQPRQPVAPSLSSIAEQTNTATAAQLAEKGNPEDQIRRPSGGDATSGTFELPHPPVGAARKMSSPTLEQYHVASRSPEQRRTSASVSSGFVLPPLKTIPSVDESSLVLQEQGLLQDNAKHVHSHAAPDTAMSSMHEPSSSIKGNSNETLTVTIKQEAGASPQDTSSSDFRRLSAHNADQDNSASKTLSSLKHEHSSHIHSPLRESSIALSTTEEPATNSAMKKRPAPAKTKKGTATAAKRPRPSKKRKADVKVPAIRSGSSKGTPAMSSPTPSDALAEDYEDEDESMADSDEDVEGSGDVYCICRKPDNGTFMIGCDGGCDDWFHGKCVSIEERDKNLIDKYICPRCAEAGIGRTSWKRMCRRQGCRLPARVGKMAGKNGATSKYCSDECGVLFFRQMTTNSRGAEQARKDRGNRRKNGAIGGTETQSDAGARGGILSTGEVRAMLDQTNTAGEFRELGNGVLSPPATPSANGPDADDGLTELERNTVKSISAQKEQARQRHQLLKDRLKFITLVKREASRAATEKELKPKDYCGFDSRLEWTEEEFAQWRSTRQGQQAFELDTLEIPAVTDTEGEAVGAETTDHGEVCSRKKCARHHEWNKLTVDDVRFETADNSDHMRSLEQQEQDIRDRASVRAKARAYGEDAAQVEVHDMQPKVPEHVAQESTEAMDMTA